MNTFFTKRTTTAMWITIFVLAIALAASGCSAAKGQGTSVNVTMTNFAFQLDKTTVPAGQVVFHVKNAPDAVTHEMVVLKTDLDAKQLPTNSDQTVDEEKLDNKGETEVTPGGSQDLTVTLEPGHYVLLCNLPGHYMQGMVANFTVQ